jgi:hypothetical protein
MGWNVTEMDGNPRSIVDVNLADREGCVLRDVFYPGQWKLCSLRILGEEVKYWRFTLDVNIEVAGNRTLDTLGPKEMDLIFSSDQEFIEGWYSCRRGVYRPFFAIWERMLV